MKDIMSTSSDVDHYISGFPAEVQEKLHSLRKIIREASAGSRKNKLSDAHLHADNILVPDIKETLSKAMSAGCTEVQPVTELPDYGVSKELFPCRFSTGKTSKLPVSERPSCKGRKELNSSWMRFCQIVLRDV